MWKCFMKFQKLIGAYVYVIMSIRLKPSLIVQRDSLKWIIKFHLKHTTFYKIKKSPGSDWKVYFILLSSVDNLCKQFGPRSAPTEYRSWSGFCWSWSGPKVFDTLGLMVLMKIIEKVNFEKKNSRWKEMHEKSPSMQIINRHLRVRQKHVFIANKMPCCK